MKDESKWWILQVQYQEKKQMQLFTDPMPRIKLLKESIEMIPVNIRVVYKNRKWGMADIESASRSTKFAKITVIPPDNSIKEEIIPGKLQNPQEPRFFSPIVINLDLQIILVNKAPEILRFARSAKAFSEIFKIMLSEAMHSLKMDKHYNLEVDPIAKKGSFIEWFNSIDVLTKICIHYVGPNLPSVPGGLIDQLKIIAKNYKKELNSESVDMIANKPEPTDEDVVELDKAVSERKLKMRASGIRSGVGTGWTSKEKPEPEIVRISIKQGEEYSSDSALKISDYLYEHFGVK